MNAVKDPADIALTPVFDVTKLRSDFPALRQFVHGNPLIYLDNAATTQKPHTVIDTLTHYYTEDYANIHRGVHWLSERATAAFERTRDTVRSFMNARDRREVIFVRGTTEAINLVAQTYGRTQLHRGDEVLISELEHHANIVPWQILCEQNGAILRVVPMDDNGDLSLAEVERHFSTRTRLVAVTHVSNALGTVTPVNDIIKFAHQNGARVLLDGAQAISHIPVDVRALDCDFYAWSGHKLYGPTGIGVLYAKAELLEAMPPYQGGGEMIRDVRFDKTTYADIPYKFEAGTPHIVGTIGLGAAIDYVTAIGMEKIAQHEQTLLDYATRRIAQVPGVRIIGTAQQKAAILSFVLDDIHAHDIGTIVDHAGVAIRVGHHCAMPAVRRFGVAATARVSFGLYNTAADVDAFIAALQSVKELFD